MGESGELVITKPIPSMPTHFWNDANGEKYQKAYFMKYPGQYHCTNWLFFFSLLKQLIKFLHFFLPDRGMIIIFCVHCCIYTTPIP